MFETFWIRNTEFSFLFEKLGREFRNLVWCLKPIGQRNTNFDIVFENFWMRNTKIGLCLKLFARKTKVDIVFFARKTKFGII